MLLTRIDGHALVANAMALRVAGVSASTRDPDGGRIERNADGSPAGVFVDNAQSLISRAIPAATQAQTRDAILAAIAEANRWGLIGIHDAGASRRTIGIYESLAREGRYNLRNYVMVSANVVEIAPRAAARIITSSAQPKRYAGRRPHASFMKA